MSHACTTGQKHQNMQRTSSIAIVPPYLTPSRKASGAGLSGQIPIRDHYLTRIHTRFTQDSRRIRGGFAADSHKIRSGFAADSQPIRSRFALIRADSRLIRG